MVKLGVDAGLAGEVVAGPAVKVTRRAADRLRAGHLWVYVSDVVELVPAVGAGGVIGAGAVVTVVDGRGMPLGSAIYSDASQIALRVISPRAGVMREEYVAELKVRVGAALDLRAAVAGADEGDAGRLIFSEADGLPGIVADRYNDLVVLQLLTQGTAQEDVRAALVEVLVARLGAGITVWERPDARSEGAGAAGGSGDRAAGG